MRMLPLFVALCCTSLLSGQDVGIINQEDGLALAGYDVVNYFRGTAVKGSPEWVATHRGVAYRFTSERNLHLFQADPGPYLPAYGGWCAYAMGSSGARVAADPETFRVVNGRLFLFSSGGLSNALKKWSRQQERLIRQADANWAGEAGN